MRFSLLSLRFGAATRLALVMAFISFAVCSCSRSPAQPNGRDNKGGDTAAADANAGPTIPVTTVKSETRNVPSYIEATGSLTANETSDVAPQTSGQVASTPVNAGAYVSQGDVIVRLNDRDARLRLQQEKAAERQAASVVRQAEVRLGLTPNARFDASTIPEVRSAAADYETALSQQKLAEANAKRYADLVETGDVARSVYDQFRTAAETARAQSVSARQRLETAVNVARQNSGAIQTAQAALDSARAQTEMAQKALADTIVRAPYSGYISARPVAVGEYVTTASVVATILTTNPLKLQVQVPEAETPKVQPGMAVALTVDAYPDRAFNGRVTAINPAIDPTSRSFMVEAAIDNPDNSLRSGMFALVRISIPGASQSVFVASNAVVHDQNTNSYRVFVVEGTTARLRVVQIGDEVNGQTQIYTGLKGDEIVATSNLQQLYEGAKVQATQQAGG